MAGGRWAGQDLHEGSAGQQAAASCCCGPSRRSSRPGRAWAGTTRRRLALLQISHRPQLPQHARDGGRGVLHGIRGGREARCLRRRQLRGRGIGCAAGRRQRHSRRSGAARGRGRASGAPQRRAARSTIASTRPQHQELARGPNRAGFRADPLRRLGCGRPWRPPSRASCSIPAMHALAPPHSRLNRLLAEVEGLSSPKLKAGSCWNAAARGAAPCCASRGASAAAPRRASASIVEWSLCPPPAAQLIQINSST